MIRSWSTEEALTRTIRKHRWLRHGIATVFRDVSINTRRADTFNLRPEVAGHNSLEMLARNGTGQTNKPGNSNRLNDGCWRQVARLIGPFLRSSSTGLEYEAAPIWITGSSLLMGKLLTIIASVRTFEYRAISSRSRRGIFNFEYGYACGEKYSKSCLREKFKSNLKVWRNTLLLKISFLGDEIYPQCFKILSVSNAIERIR